MAQYTQYVEFLPCYVISSRGGTGSVVCQWQGSSSTMANILADMNWPQPPNSIQIYDSTASGIVNRTVKQHRSGYMIYDFSA